MFRLARIHARYVCTDGQTDNQTDGRTEWTYGQTALNNNRAAWIT